jgi:hypothetical protein
LEPRVDKLEKFSKAAVGMIPGFFEHDNRITLLETKIDEIITDCLTLRKMYSREQAAAALPFSDWVADSAAVAPDPKTRLGARIVLTLGIYDDQAQSYAVVWKGDPLDGPLFKIISSLKYGSAPGEVSLDQFTAILREHRGVMRKRQEAYAARWTKDVTERATIP